VTTWTIEGPQKLTFDRVRMRKVRTIGGTLSVVGTDDQQLLEGRLGAGDRGRLGAGREPEVAT